MTQRIGIETPHGVMYCGDKCEVFFSGVWNTNRKGCLEDDYMKIVRIEASETLIRVYVRNVAGYCTPEMIRPIPQKTVRPMTDDEILDLAEDPKVWFRCEAHTDRYLLRLYKHTNYYALVGVGTIHTDLIRYTRDRGKTWHKLEVEE